MNRPRAIPPPDFLDEEAKGLWRRTQRALREQGTWRDHDAELLALFVRSVELARTARAAASDEPFVAGSRGQLVPHPGWRLVREAEQDAARYASELLLTPRARARNGVKTPERSDDDGFPFLVA